MIIGSIYTSINMFLTFFHLDTTQTINVCSAGAAPTLFSGYFSTVFGTIVFLLLFSRFIFVVSKVLGIYFSTLFIIYRYEKYRNSQIASALKFQRKVFVSASLVLLCYMVFWAGPFVFNILGLVKVCICLSILGLPL